MRARRSAVLRAPSSMARPVNTTAAADSRPDRSACAESSSQNVAASAVRPTPIECAQVIKVPATVAGLAKMHLNQRVMPQVGVLDGADFVVSRQGNEPEDGVDAMDDPRVGALRRLARRAGCARPRRAVPGTP